MLHSVVFEKINSMPSRKEVLIQKSYVKMERKTKPHDVNGLFLIRAHYIFTVKRQSMLHSAIWEKIHGMSGRQDISMQKRYVEGQETKSYNVIDLFLIRVYHIFTVERLHATVYCFGENKWHVR